MAVNFDFLKQSNPKLYEYGHIMEDNMFTNDKASAHYGGEFLDELVREICRKQGINFIEDSLMVKTLDELQMNHVIPQKIYALFERAKLLHDKAELDGNRDRILELHAVLEQLASWFFNKYEKGQNN